MGVSKKKRLQWLGSSDEFDEMIPTKPYMRRNIIVLRFQLILMWRHFSTWCKCTYDNARQIRFPKTISLFSDQNCGHWNHRYAVQKDISSEPRFQRFQCKKNYAQKIILIKVILSRVGVGHADILMSNVTERPEIQCLPGFNIRRQILRSFLSRYIYMTSIF